MYALIDLGHYQPFKATAYTAICAFDMATFYEKFDYSVYEQNGKIKFQECLTVTDAFNNGKMILAKKREQEILKNIQNYVSRTKDLVQVKNAFATLADSVFIQYQFAFQNDDIIDVIKASTGEWKKCIFPYDINGIKKIFSELTRETQDYLLLNKDTLDNRSLDKNSEWHEFGRSQALNDVSKYKIAVNTTIKDINSIKLNEVKSGQGIYSGLYILTDVPYDKIANAVRQQDFIDYIATIGKCKSGGYYTFSSNELKQYLIYKLESN
jgi:adenine-specific DNA-methyltransferase